jgi:hypothetical protein
MTRRALILGTLPGQLDAVDALRGVGWEVSTCGHRMQSRVTSPPRASTSSTSSTSRP